MVAGKKGLLPGDKSYEINFGSSSIGIIALNSTWLQIDDTDYEGKLHVDVKQLLAVTDNDPQTWCNKHTFNLIVTHHPIDWLHENSQANWRSDINPPGRFDLHLFGHLHRAASSSTSVGGSPFRNAIQAPSVFGLTYTKEGIERLHGYSISRLTLANDSRQLKFWPRTLHHLQSGGRKLGPDLSFDLGVDNSTTLPLNTQIVRNDDDAPAPPRTDLSLRTIASDSRGVLKKIQHHLPFAPAHANVRKIEQRRLLEALSDGRAAWLIAEWGMDSDSFVSSVRKIKGELDRPAYRLDLADYKNRDQFFETIRDVLDCSFQQLCEVFSLSGESLLLLDNFPAGAADNFNYVDHDIEDLVKVILEYCPSLTILIRSRRNPVTYTIPLMQLRALDEADLRTYILEHRRGGTELVAPNSIGVLLRHTDGIPARIDRTLKDLEVIPLSELMNMDSDVMTTSVEEATSPSLSKVIKDLAASGDLRYQRSFFLLKVLSLFPQGEQLARIKRFYQNMPFFPAHATELLDQALIEVTTVQRLEKEVGSVAKTLVVPRPVRECVRSLMEHDEILRMNHRAAEIYFGQHWMIGTFKFPTAYKFDEPHCANADLGNASTIILRLVREAIAMEDSQHLARTAAANRTPGSNYDLWGGESLA